MILQNLDTTPSLFRARAPVRLQVRRWRRRGAPPAARGPSAPPSAGSRLATRGVPEIASVLTGRLWLLQSLCSRASILPASSACRQCYYSCAVRMRAGPSRAGLGLRIPSTMWQQHHAGTRPAPRLQRLHRGAGSGQAIATAGQKRLVVVLDMDECLIHSTNFSDNASGYRQSEDRPDAVKQAVETFMLEMGDGVTCTVHKRPGLHDFLAAWYETSSLAHSVRSPGLRAVCASFAHASHVSRNVPHVRTVPRSSTRTCLLLVPNPTRHRCWTSSIRMIRCKGDATASTVGK
eukprot:COSAG02_NODE_558_length_20348_cov_6.479431_11_plen_291_part_00